jgi:hypothetical protein
LVLDLRGKDEFQFFVPMDIAKSDDLGETKGSKRLIQGIASTEHVDLQGETVVQSGIDTSYFMKYGWINDDHRQGPEHKVGEPLECRATKAGLWIKALLYKGNGDERCDYWWNLIQTLERSGSPRKVGFSIEGKIIRRAGKSILKCWLKDIAITASPVNTNSWAEIVKSLSAERWCIHPWKSLEKACKGCPGNASCDTSIPAMLRSKEDEEKALTAAGNGAALRVQSLEGGAPKTTTFKSLPDRISREDAIEYLRVSKGYSLPTARAVADVIFARVGDGHQLGG